MRWSRRFAAAASCAAWGTAGRAAGSRPNSCGTWASCSASAARSRTSARRLRELVAGMPLEHLLLETDAPDQSDSAIRGQRNEPARLRTVCETIAELRGVPVEEISSATTGNAERLFGLMPAERAADRKSTRLNSSH